MSLDASLHVCLALLVCACLQSHARSSVCCSPLLAALVGGMHGPAVQGTLQAAGLAPLAAVYSAGWLAALLLLVQLCCLAVLLHSWVSGHNRLSNCIPVEGWED